MFVIFNTKTRTYYHQYWYCGVRCGLSVLMLLYMCRYYYICVHTTTLDVDLVYSCYYICVTTTIYVSSYYYYYRCAPHTTTTCVLILLHTVVRILLYWGLSWTHAGHAGYMSACVRIACLNACLNACGRIACLNACWTRRLYVSMRSSSMRSSRLYVSMRTYSLLERMRVRMRTYSLLERMLEPAWTHARTHADV